MKQNYRSFQMYANILLAGMTGVMIAYPFALDSLVTSQNEANGSAIRSYIILLTALLAGLAVGYRRRNSRVFLYFCMLAVIILAAVISSSVKI